MNEEPAVLLESQAARSTPTYLMVCMFVLGLLLLGSGAVSLLGGSPAAEELTYVLVGCACLYGAGYRKRIYLTADGVARRTRSWTSRNAEDMAWSDLRQVTLAFKSRELLALFEKDGLIGWKVPFLPEQADQLRDILHKYAPDVPVETMGK